MGSKGISFIFTLATLLLGYIAFGFWTMMLFSFGFFGGFVLWIAHPHLANWKDIKWPYYLGFILFLVHRVEEKQMEFFRTLSEITGVATPEIVSFPVIALVLMSVGGWLFVPFLVKRKSPFGTYLAWTFFAALGITELAHIFIFPFLVDRPYGYFPGMASVFALAPIAWWGMWRLYNRRDKEILGAIH